VISGHTYTVLIKFDYVGANPSNAALLSLGHSSAADITYTFAGTTPTATLSSCSGATITTVGSHKEFTCQWAPSATADMFMQFGPNSATNTKDVTLYAISIRDNAVLP
jgi:hypothetical protein